MHFASTAASSVMAVILTCAALCNAFFENPRSRHGNHFIDREIAVFTNYRINPLYVGRPAMIAALNGNYDGVLGYGAFDRNIYLAFSSGVYVFDEF
jgi:hypothetical protein